ncbi:hypothetical protein C0J52_20200 [Blattella germanica]|nr:hypothetical protein C0J52_20200 [Blattella germanica]
MYMSTILNILDTPLSCILNTLSYSILDRQRSNEFISRNLCQRVQLFLGLLPEGLGLCMVRINDYPQ